MYEVFLSAECTNHTKGFNKIFHYSDYIQSYGENCQYPCNIHCVNQTCNRFHRIVRISWNVRLGTMDKNVNEVSMHEYLPKCWLLSINWKDLLSTFINNFNILNFDIIFFRISINIVIWFYLSINQRMRVYSYRCCDIYYTVSYVFVNQMIQYKYYCINRYHKYNYYINIVCTRW